jgi:hypothetical protein
MEIVFGEKAKIEEDRSPSFQIVLAIVPHHPQSTAPYISEGRCVID